MNNPIITSIALGHVLTIHSAVGSYSIGLGPGPGATNTIEVRRSTSPGQQVFKSSSIAGAFRKAMHWINADHPNQLPSSTTTKVELNPPPSAPKPDTQDELQSAFNLVSNKQDWRGEINATIPRSAMGIVSRAISHFTATAATFSPLPNDRLRVRSPGYHAGPAGAH